MHSDQSEREGSGFGKKVASAALNVAPIVATLATTPLANPFLTAATGVLTHTLRKTIKQKTGYGQSGGKITSDKIVKGVKKAAKVALPVALDLVPGAVTLGTTALTANPVAGFAAGAATKLGRNAIKEFTGYGLDAEKVKKTAKRVGKVLATTALDLSPAVARTVGALALQNPAVGLPVAGAVKIGREVIRQKYGLGMKQCGHKHKCKCGEGLNKQKLKNIAKKGTTAVLDSIPMIAGMTANHLTDAALPGGVAYGAAQLVREGIRAKTGLGLHNKKLSKKIISHLNKHYKRKNVIGGAFDFNFDTFKNELGPIIQKYVSEGLDLAIPMICEEISKHYLGNKQVGKQAGEYIWHIIKNYTGFGFDMASLGKRPGLAKTKPLLISHDRPHIQPRKGGGARKLNSRLENRNKVVREVMKKQGLSWIEASKYVANNKIKY